MYKSKACKAKYDKCYYSKNKKSILKRKSDYRRLNLLKFKDKDRNYLLSAYSLNKESFLALFKKQKSKCAICNSTTTKGLNWHVDHCHKTNKVRGILCLKCNVGLGHFNDSKRLLKAAYNYL